MQRRDTTIAKQRHNQKETRFFSNTIFDLGARRRRVEGRGFVEGRKEWARVAGSYARKAASEAPRRQRQVRKCASVQVSPVKMGVTRKSTKEEKDWTADEDALLVRLAGAQQGAIANWAVIASSIPGRTPKQCRERWHLNLDPSINRAPF